MTMWKTAAVGAAALVIAGSAMVYAQQRQGGAPGGFGGPRDVPAMGGGWHPSAQDMSAFAEARIAALHAGLALSADQEKSWPAFEQALRELSKMRLERLSAARDQQPSADPIERLQRRADAMTTRGAALKKLADAAAPLYQSLDDAQKHRFAVLARFMRPREPHPMMGRERFGGGPGGPGGFGGPDGPGGMRGEFQMGPHRFGEGRGMRDPRGMMRDPHGMMGGPRGMGGMRDDDDDYRGPL
jgi:zinc resistance-associated protein